jgi:hypothetical protein
MTKHIRFWYDKALDRVTAEFLVVVPADIITEHVTVVSNDELEVLEEYVDFTRLYTGDAAFVTVTPEDLEPVFEYTALDDTNFADMYDRFTNA